MTAAKPFMKTVLLAGRTRAVVPGKRLNQRQHVCNNSPITNNSKTSKGEIKMSDQENRNPQPSDSQKPAPPEQKPVIQPNQPVQQKPVVPIAQPKSSQSEPEKHDQPQKKQA
jgi:hypothetical protein